ncbi:unnamed protein product [Vitrella brassicaformis CCMP3155]|uniref:Uncharacterized protein n=3 Tax=Vitrella brassicaformis TaxID=1169539 RepID=A0A0G4ERS5_VITBC|nr:unnamed protein product [Vitrella brassicaformis CCMP3155]|eukprot:CEM00592.1 unnamed protein product [Vitrella brassicaformis CCMP3155]
MRQISMCRFLLPVARTDQADQGPQQRHADTDFTTPEARAIAKEIITQRQLASPPPNASLCGFQPEKLANVCEHIPTHEAIRLGLINKAMQDTCQSPFVVRHLDVTPASHKLWRKAPRSVLRQLRGRLTRLQTASITTDAEAYSRGPDEDRLGDEAASVDGQQRDGGDGEDSELREADGEDGAADEEGIRRHDRAHGHRSVFAKMLEASAASLKKCGLGDKTQERVRDLPAGSNEARTVVFEKLEAVVLAGALWADAAYSRAWTLPAIKAFVGVWESETIPQHVQQLTGWIQASKSLTHVHSCDIDPSDLAEALSAAPSLTHLTTLGCIGIQGTDASSWEPLLSVIEKQGAVGRIESLGIWYNLPVSADTEDLQEDPAVYEGIRASLSALEGVVRRLAGRRISAADMEVTAIPVPLGVMASRRWSEHVMANVVRRTPHVDHNAAQSSASGSNQTAGRKGALFPNMVPRDGDGDASGRGAEADSTPTQRPFQLLIYMPGIFDDKLLRLDLTASDVLPRKVIREMARVAPCLHVRSAPSHQDALRGSLGDCVFESANCLKLLVNQPSHVLPLVPPPLSSRVRRFPKLTVATVHASSPSMEALDTMGIRPFLREVGGPPEEVVIGVGDGSLDPQTEMARARGLAEFSVECISEMGVSRLRTFALVHCHATTTAEVTVLPHLLTTPRLAARLPPIQLLALASPYCVHDRFGTVQMDFIMSVVNSTPGLQRVVFKSMTEIVESQLPGRLWHYRAYLATAAVDEALASAGSPFVVVSADDITLTLAR